MFETTVTVVGRLITSFQPWRFGDGTLKVSARVACTERRYDRTGGEWVDGQTLYVTVVCKRGLAENAFLSLHVGDPVVVHGKLYTREYEKDGRHGSVAELEAWSVGPDLQWCTAAVTRKARAAAPVDPGEIACAGSPAPADHGPVEPRGSADVAWVATPPAERAGAAPSTGPSPSDDPWASDDASVVRADEAAVGV